MTLNLVKMARLALPVWSFLIVALIWPIPLAVARSANGIDERILELEFREAKIVDIARVLSEISDVNVVVTDEAADKAVTVFLRDVSIGEVIDTVCKISGLWFREDLKTGVYRIMETDQYQKDIVIYRDDILEVFTMRHYNVTSAAYAIQTLFGQRVQLQLDRRADDTGLGGNQQVGFGSGNQGGSGQFNQPGNSQGSGFNNNFSGFNNQGFGMFGGGGAGGIDQAFGRDMGVESLDLTVNQISAIDEEQGKGGDGLSNVKATSLVELTAREAPIRVTTSRLHNLIMVRTSDEAAVKEIRRLLENIDRAAPQVLLELEILDLQLGDDFTSVFDVDYTSTGQTSGPASGEPRNPLLPADQTVTTGPNTALGVGNFPLDGGQLLFQWMNENVRVRLQLAEEQNRIKTLGSPILLASNNTPARIFVGEEVVLTTGVRAISNFGAIGAAQNIIQPETQVVDIGNTLEIVPRVNSDGTVTLSVNSDISTLKKDATFIPISTADGNVVQYPVDGVNDSTVKGTFLAEDGMTVAVGGLVRTSDSLVEQKVPFLGDIKYLGFFFKSEKRTQKTSELIVLITPRVFWNSNDAETRSLDLVEELSAAGVRDGFASDGRRLLLETIEGHHEFNDEDDVLELETRGSKGNKKTGAE